MGEGKTEAALFVAEHQKQRHDLRGSYIALPTQASSNQMFGRVVKALSQEAFEGIAHILLLHGHASLSSEFNDLKRKGQTGFLPSSVEPDGSADAQVMAGEWFTYRKRGLLAPYGVGTVDQALMAALQSKHVFVRLLGLAGKVVVIDEVHAYDTYMSALLERLLAWLRAIGTSVVMLSATLPNSRRAALVQAFAPECEVPCETPPYPCLTVVSDSQVRTIAFAPAAPGKRIRLDPAPSEPAALAVWLRDRISGGGCAAVVCNTVGRAQEIYEACRQAMPEDAEDGAPMVDLLHSRFPFEEREVREQRTLKRFGKPGEAARPVKAVLVATQIIEQSLDIDFDLMVAELPPLDLLFQRAGRLHRHERGPRPTGEMPALGLIETPLAADGAPGFPRGHTMVYAEHILLRTWIALRDRSELRIPEEIRSSIEAVYTDHPRDVPEEPALRSIWETTARKLQASRDADLREADLRYLPHPGKGIGLDALTAMGRDEDDDLHPFFRALTRLTERTVTVVCLFGSGDDRFLNRACTRPLSLNKVAVAGAAEILRRSCSISDKRVVYSLEALPIPPAWKKNALLRNCRPLTFDADDCCPVGKHRLRLCPNRGLMVEENPS